MRLIINVFENCITQVISITAQNYNSYKGSLIEIRDLGNNKVLEIQSVQEQNCFSEMKNIFSIPKFNEVELYFNERDLPSFEANEFTLSMNLANGNEVIKN